MAELMKIAWNDETSIYIETDNSQSESGNSPAEPVARSSFGNGIPVSADNTIQKAREYLDDAANQISSFADAIISKMRRETLAPDEVEIEFAVKFSADLGAVIAKAGAESEVTVKAKWKKDSES